MKRIFVLILLLLCVPTGVIAADKELPPVHQDVKGMEWLELPIGSRLNELTAAMFVLSSHGVKLHWQLNDYYQAINETLRRHPELMDSRLSDIVANYVYEHEKDSRPALDALRAANK